MGVDPISMMTVATIVKTALEGAIAGGAVGGITGGGKGALKGAAVGGLTGAVTGGVASQIPVADPGATQAVTSETQAAASSGASEATVSNVAQRAAETQVAPKSTGLLGSVRDAAGSVVRGAKKAAADPFGTVKAVAGNETVQKAALGGAGLLASKALAGDTSPGAAPKAPSSTASAASAAAAAERERRRQAGAGRASTILTSPLGISRPASVGAKVLLGA